MAEVLYLPGFATTKKGTERVSRSIAEATDRDVESVQLGKAISLPPGFFEKFEHIYSNSGGTFATRNSNPEKLTILAPVVPRARVPLAVSGARAGQGPSEHDDGSSLREEILTPSKLAMSTWLLLRLGGFNAIHTAKEMAHTGTDVEIAIFQDDQLFSEVYRRPETCRDITAAQEAGVNIRHFNGGHFTFTKDPVGILRQLGHTGL